MTLDNEDVRATDCGMLQPLPVVVCNFDSGNPTMGIWNVFGTAASIAKTPEKNYSREEASDEFYASAIEKKRRQILQGRVVAGEQKNKLRA